MIGSSYKAIYVSLVEVIIEASVYYTCPLRSLYENKGNRAVAHSSVPKTLPFYTFLIMTHIYTSDGVFRRKNGFPVNGLPLKAVWVYEEMK